MSRSTLAGIDNTTLQQLLKIARFHREHERFYATKGLEDASSLRRDASALMALADRWAAGGARQSETAETYRDPGLQAAGCEDLNDSAALAMAGILFMEGEQEPAEISRLKRKFSEIGESLTASSRWLEAKMDAGWRREAQLLNTEFAEAAYPRHIALAHTTLSAAKMDVAGRLVRAAHDALAAYDYRPQAVRADPPAVGRLLRSAAWLLDAAAAVLAEQAADLAKSDPHWTAYIKDLEARLDGTERANGLAANRAASQGKPAARDKSTDAPQSGA